MKLNNHPTVIGVHKLQKVADWKELYLDTDDEVEESSAIDDAYKNLEGDWW